MSKLKTPREKKLASLALDCRNIYGESDKASRKSIPLRKQLSHQAFRRAAREPLQGVASVFPEDEIVSAEHTVLEREIGQRRKAFKKRPDAPLAKFIKRQAYWAQRRKQESDYWKARRHTNSVETQ